MGKSLSARVTLLLGAAFLPLAVASAASAQTSAGPAPAQDSTQPQQSQATGTSGPETPTAPSATGATLDEIVVTGQTTRNRPQITSSADITFATAADIDRRSPKSLSDLLELVPGIFVEGTAGEVSNNYSVRGLRGGSQRFVQIEEDGLPIIYGGGGADEFFKQDLNVNRLEAVKGGSSGVLTANGAGATINLISRLPNFDHAEGIVRFQGYSYGRYRGDFYYTSPITDKLAFNIGGFIQTSPGVRSNPFNYRSYQIKGALEYKMDNGGFIRLTGRIGDWHDAYYADQPYTYRGGNPGSIPGLDTQFGNIGGNAFARVDIPSAPAFGNGPFREFRYDQGIHSVTKQLRLDVDVPHGDFDFFGKAQYLGLTWNFNGLFPGSGQSFSAGLAPAATYLNSAATGGSPIQALLAAGQIAFPNTVQFGVKDLTNGVIYAANNPALAGLNGNGLLEQTVLNHDQESGHNFSSNFGFRWEHKGEGYSNSLTAGALIFDTKRFTNQSSTAYTLNDVQNNSHLYDVVGLDAAGNTTGTLTDNGILSYGNWGVGARVRGNTSYSGYVNDELQIGKLRVDAGVRYEFDDEYGVNGNNLTPTDPVVVANPTNFVLSNPNAAGVFQCADPRPAGLSGIIQPTSCQFWNGTYSGAGNVNGKVISRRENQAYSYTVGANYLFTPNVAVYARYADGFQTNGVDAQSGVAGVELYEAGARFQSRYLVASATYFHTNFNNDSYNGIDPNQPTLNVGFNANEHVDGVEIDATIKPLRWFAIDFVGVFQDPKLSSLTSTDPAFVPGDYAGHRPERTPTQLFTITPTVKLPGGKGEIYARYNYVGKVFADAGNAIALPAYGVTSLGFTYNLSERLEVNFNAENVFNEFGLTEGNPRQGQTQSAGSGYFYARGIVGTTYNGGVTFKF